LAFIRCRESEAADSFILFIQRPTQPRRWPRSVSARTLPARYQQLGRSRRRKPFYFPAAKHFSAPVTRYRGHLPRNIYGSVSSRADACA
jgi:hypothetical protein